MKEKLKELDTDTVKNSLKNNKGLLAASLIVLLAIYIRYIPASDMEYLQALDSYLIYRFSQHIALDWSFPALDFMRYFPYAFPTYAENLGSFFIPAIFYWMGPFLFFSYLEWAQLFPALMGGLSVLAVYYIGKEAFDELTGISAAFFLATIAGIMHRSGAGFFQKDPTSAAFMMVSMYFFIRAWKRSSWYSGIGAGLALGLATTSWGGSSMLWLLYALTIGVMLWINEDIRQLVTAYTPTVLVGAVLAASINHDRFWLTDLDFLANLAMLGFLWSRYLVEELDLIKKPYLPYYTPSLSIIGLVTAALSPLYSQTLADMFIRMTRRVTRQSSGTDTIAGTVAENTPVTLGELSTQLGAVGVSQAHAFLSEPYNVLLSPLTAIGGLIANINGAWPLAFIGIVFLSTTIVLMLLKKLEFVEDTIADKTFYKIAAVVLVVWIGAFSFVFEDPTSGATFIAAGPAVLALVGGIGILKTLEEFGERKIDIEWYHVLIILWAITNILAASAQSRLVFLASFPTAFMAGYMFARVVRNIRSLKPETSTYLALSSSILILDILLIIGLLLSGIGFLPAVVAVAILNGLGFVIFNGKKFDKFSFNTNTVNLGLLGVVILVTVLVNLGSAYSAANSLGESPNELWMENLDYFNEEASEDSVILSWWDYGYHFQSLGQTASVADGGNLGYYTDGERIPYTIAEFLASDSPEEYGELFEKHSVDYIVLDETMIGKYSAVSQISNRDNENFDTMMQLSTSDNIQDSVTESGNRTIVQYSGQGMQAYVPVQTDGETVEISSAPTIESREFRGQVSCVLTDQGVQEFDVDQSLNIDGFGEMCVAENPYFSITNAVLSGQQGFGMGARLVLVPENIVDSTLVRLYLMNGYGIDFVEEVSEASNDYVKTWEVDHEGL